MTKADISKLLTLCASYDQRTIGPSDVDAWHLAIGDLDPSDCAQAIATYYRVTEDPRAGRIGVGQVFAGVRKIRAERIARMAPVQPPPSIDPDRPEEYRAWLRQAIQDAASGVAVIEPERLVPVPRKQITAMFREIPKQETA